MAMRETASSIRTYFLLVGVVSGGINALNFAAGLKTTAFILVLLPGIGLLLAASYFIVGLLMPRLIGGGAKVPKMLIGISCLYLIGLMALLMQILPPEKAGSASVQPLIGLLINWYLWSNLTRMSAEYEE